MDKAKSNRRHIYNSNVKDYATIIPVSCVKTTLQNVLIARRRRKFLGDVVVPIKTGDMARQWKFSDWLMD
jgi:hypothetical protein